MPKARLLERVSLSLSSTMANGANWSSEALPIPRQPISLRAGRDVGAKAGIEHRTARALRCVLDGELSAGRQALEGEELARGTQETLDAPKDREGRPPDLRDPLPDRVVNHVPHTPGPRIVRTSVEELEAGRSSRSLANDGGASASDARE